MPRQAPLTKNDIRIIFQEENKPIVALLEIHEKAIQTNTQFLFGANGNNGLNSEYKGIKERLLAVETEQELQFLQEQLVNGQYYNQMEQIG